jgi:hypothetical protein
LPKRRDFKDDEANTQNVLPEHSWQTLNDQVASGASKTVVFSATEADLDDMSDYQWSWLDRETTSRSFEKRHAESIRNARYWFNRARLNLSNPPFEMVMLGCRLSDNLGPYLRHYRQIVKAKIDFLDEIIDIADTVGEYDTWPQDLITAANNTIKIGNVLSSEEWSFDNEEASNHATRVTWGIERAFLEASSWLDQLEQDQKHSTDRQIFAKYIIAEIGAFFAIMRFDRLADNFSACLNISKEERSLTSVYTIETIRAIHRFHLLQSVVTPMLASLLRLRSPAATTGLTARIFGKTYDNDFVMRMRIYQIVNIVFRSRWVTENDLGLDTTELEVKSFKNGEEPTKLLSETFATIEKNAIQVNPANSGGDSTIAQAEIKDEKVNIPPKMTNDSQDNGVIVILEDVSVKRESESIIVTAANLSKRKIPLFAIASQMQIGDVVERLEMEFPHFGIVPRRFCSMLLSRHSLRFKPVLLLGPAGIGKSHFARRFATLIGLPHKVVSMSAAADASFAGTSKQWNSARMSIPLQTIVQNKIANPLIILDELDKIPRSNHNGSTGEALLAMTEWETAENMHDLGLDVSVNISWVNYIATANRMTTIDPTLLDRFEVIELPAPRAEDLPRLAASLALNMKTDFPEALYGLSDWEMSSLRKHWRGGSTRTLARMIEKLLRARDVTAPRQ